MKGLKQRLCEYKNYEKDLILPIPKNMLLEVTNACNHKCIFCANSKSTKRQRIIDDKFAYRILKEAYELGTREVGFYGTGEPLVNNNLEKYIKYAKELGYEYTYITTNGALLTEERMKKIVESGIDSIKFSFNAGNKISYEFIHGKDEYELVKENIKKLSEYREENNGEFKIYISCILTSFTKDEGEQIKKDFERYVDEIVLLNCKNQCGVMYEINKFLIIKDEIEENKEMCSLPFNKLHITSEGYLTACCADFQNYLVVANLNNCELKEAWNNEAFINLRKKHINGNLQNTLCYNCINNVNEKIYPIVENLSVGFKKEEFDKTEEILERIKCFNNKK